MAVAKYKKTKGTVTYIYDDYGNIIDWYTSYKNMKDKAAQYADLEEKK